jgi:hypothetical protein
MLNVHVDSEADEEEELEEAKSCSFSLLSDNYSCNDNNSPQK